MKFFSKSRSLAVSAASVALAAAVLLTGCGGSDGGGGNGGGSTPNQPSVQPEEPVQPGEPEKPEEPKEEMDETKTIAAPGEEIKTEEVTMKVDIADDVAGNVQTDKDANITYTPFTFNIKNTSGKRIDLNEEPVQLRARSMIALCADTKESTSLADKFNSGKQSKNLTVKMNGKDVPAKMEIQVYNAAGVEQGGTVLEEEGWYAEFDVVARVPDADWVEKNEPLKVNYTLPEQKDDEGNVTVQAVNASFAVTSNGEAPKAVLTFEDQTAIGLGRSAYIEYDNFYMVNHIITITNEENSASAVDISGFMGKEETQAMAAALQTRATELANAATTYSGMLKASAQAYQEIYTSGKYSSKAVEITSGAPCVAAQNPNTAKKKYLNPGESVQVQVSVYVEKGPACGFTAKFDGNEMFTVKDEDYDNLTEENSTKNTSDNYTKFPQIMGQTGVSDIWQKEGETAGQLIQVNAPVANSTSNDFNTQNTLTALGIKDREQLSDLTLAKVRSGNAAAAITATVYTKNGKTYANLPVVVARGNGVDPILKQDQMDRLFAFTFVPCGESDEWTYITFYMTVDGKPVNMLSFPNPNQSTTPSEPSDGKDIGNGKLYPAIKDESQSNLSNMVLYNGNYLGMTGYVKNSGVANRIGLEMAVVNVSDTGATFPLENAYVSGSQQSYKFENSQYLTIEGSSEKVQVLTFVSGTSTAALNVGDNALIRVTFSVPEGWSEVILRYTFPDGRYARFHLTVDDEMTDDSGSGSGSDSGSDSSSGSGSEEDKDTTSVMDAYSSDSRWGWVEETDYLTDEQLSNAWVVRHYVGLKNTSEDTSLRLKGAVTESQIEAYRNQYMQDHKEETYVNGEQDPERLAAVQAAALRAAVEQYADKRVMAVVDGKEYPVVILVGDPDGKYGPMSQSSVQLLTVLPDAAKNKTVAYTINGQTIQTRTYGDASATDALRAGLANLRRAVVK